MRFDCNLGIVLNPVASFGGAQKRFTYLFKYLYEKDPKNVYYFISYELLEKIKLLYPDYPLNNVRIIGKHGNNKIKSIVKENTSLLKSGINDQKISFLRKIYRWVKSYRNQYYLYREIEYYRKEYKIKVFFGISSGILPLYFYLKFKRRKVGIVFCNMDSWFSDIYSDIKKYWYKKYSSYNFALENSDIVDFLSPFIVEGIKKRGIKIRDEAISITPCSFTDYSKCRIGNKKKFQVAFASRLEKDKNPWIFLEAAIKLSSKYPEIIFHIMGEGRLSLNIKGKVEQINFKNIIFHGFHPNPTDILTETLVFVSIQSTNNYPSQSVLEAMACGNAIIATDVGDTRMFINEKNGLLINLGVSELFAAVEYLYLGQQKTKEMGLFAEKYVKENHTIEKSAKYYQELFTKTNAKVYR